MGQTWKTSEEESGEFRNLIRLEMRSKGSTKILNRTWRGTQITEENLK
jgi:hypothetical protein